MKKNLTKILQLTKALHRTHTIEQHIIEHHPYSVPRCASHSAQSVNDNRSFISALHPTGKPASLANLRLLMAIAGFLILTALGTAPLFAANPLRLSQNETIPPVLTLQTVGSGSIVADPPQTEPYILGQTINLTALPSFGFSFAGWSEDLSGTENPTSIIMTGNRAVTATFAPQPPSTIESDDFNQCVLDTNRWTFTDPVGDAGLFPTGEAIEISVPEGAGHDIWSTGNDAPRLMQSVNDVDFVIESKLESRFDRRLQMQGVLVMNDEANLIRINVQYDGRDTRLLAATFVNSTPTIRANEVISGGVPIFLRATRTGNEWHVDYGYNGSSWLTADALTFTHSMSVTEVGLFAGNSGGNPAFTGIFDYFFNRASAINPEDPVRNTIPVHTVGQGTVERGCGNPLLLKGIPAPGWNFAQWSGSVDSTVNPITFPITGQEIVTATFTPKPYELSLNIVGGGQITTTPKQQYFDLNDQVRLDAVADPGWIFTGWSGDVQSSNLALTVTVTGNLSINANFAVLDDQSGFRSDDFNRCVLSDQWQFTDPQGDATLYLSGDTLQLSVPAGVEHNIWTTGNFAPRLMQPVADSDFELEAMFLSPLERRFQLQGLLIEGDANNFVRLNFQSDGSSVSLLAVTFTDGNPTVRVNRPVAISGPLALRVVRSGNLWSLLYAGADRKWITGDNFTFAFDLPVTAAGVFVGNAGGNPAHTAIVDYFFTTSAPIVPEDGNPIQLETATVGRGEITLTPAQEQYECGQPVEVLAAPEPGWTFQGWQGALTGMINPSTITPFAPETVTAIFAEAAYALNVTTDGFGLVTIEPDKPTYQYGEQVVLTAVTGSGWHLASWSGDLTATGDVLTITMESDLAVHATFARNEYKLTIVQEGEGTIAISPQKQTYVEGETVLVNATAADGWVFTGWSGAFTGASSSATLFMDQDQTLTAHFKRPVTLTTSVQGSGQIAVDPASPPYYQGDSVQLSAIADAGWTFAGWSGSLTGVANPATLVLTDDETVVALFVEGGIDLQIQIQNDNGTAAGGTVTQSPQGPYTVGQNVTLTATPAAGYQFDRWEVLSGPPLATEALTAPTLVLTLDEATTLVAHFRAVATTNELFLPIVSR